MKRVRVFLLVVGLVSINGLLCDTTLIEAVKNKNLPRVQELIEVEFNVRDRDRIDLNGRDGMGDSALAWAARIGELEILSALIAKGANVDIPNYRKVTPLMWAVWNGHEDIVEALIRVPVDIELQDNEGKTALVYAQEGGHENIVALLKADVILVPGTDLKLNLNKKDLISLGSFKELSEAPEGVNIIEIPTGKTSPPSYFEDEGLKAWVQNSLYVNPFNKQIFHRNDIIVFNVKKQQDGGYIVTEKNVEDIFPEGMVSERAKYFFDEGVFYYESKPPMQNYPEAQEYFEKVAEQDDNPYVKANAELNLGLMYYNGQIGDAPNYPKAQEYYERAAEQTVNPNVKAIAEFNLGAMYDNGKIGDAPNYPKAQEYFERAAGQTVNPNVKAQVESFLQKMRTEGKI